MEISYNHLGTLTTEEGKLVRSAAILSAQLNPDILSIELLRRHSLYSRAV